MPNRLFLGTRRYSSWSLRGWLAVRAAGLEAEDVVIPLADGPTQALAELTPAGLVPALEHDGLIIWDSLAIGEYCAELHPALWPAKRAHRAIARAVAAEMHAGFRELRIAMPMNLGRAPAARPLTQPVMQDISRIDRVWRQCLAAGHPYLFGETLTLADIMYAPVVARFITYQPTLSAPSQAYCRTIRAHPLMEEWYRLAAAEPKSWRLAKYE